MKDRYIFTVASGRCGQSSFAKVVNTHVDDCYGAFEEPSMNLRFAGALGVVERSFRRRFVETHELLGRGKVLSAFDRRDESYLDKIVAKRLKLIEKKPGRIYFDVSKFFARGLHRAFMRACPGLGVVLLVRDPIQNMRSFLNRAKDYSLDNNMPEARSNILRISSEDFEKGEFYLWIWCELFLRYLALIEEFNVTSTAIIRTEDLNDADKMNAHFDALDLKHSPVVPKQPRNTNIEIGRGETIISSTDVELFERFLNRLPSEVIEKITYFDNYKPRDIWL